MINTPCKLSPPELRKMENVNFSSNKGLPTVNEPERANYENTTQTSSCSQWRASRVLRHP